MSFVTGVIRREDSRPIFEMTASGNGFTLHGKTFDRSGFALLFQNAHSKAVSMLDSMGDFTVLPPNLELTGDSLVDDTPNFSFLGANKQVIRPLAAQSLKAVLTRTGPSALVLQHNEVTGNSVWSFPRMEEFMEKAATILDCILILMHITGGQPVRGPEILSTTFRNMPNVHRSLFIHLSRLMTIYTYHKVCADLPLQCIHLTDAFLQGLFRRGAEKLIPRFFHDMIMTVLLRYLITIRPIEELFAGILWGPEAKERYHHILFVHQGRQMTTSYLSRQLKKHTAAAFNGLEMATADFRQASAGLGHDLKLGMIEPEEQLGTLDETAGHSSTTAERFYAFLPGNPGQLTSLMMARFRAVDELWDYRIYGLKPLHQILQLDKILDAHTTLTEFQAPFQAPVQSVLDPLPAADALAPVMTALEAAIQSAIAAAIPKIVSQVVSQLAVHIPVGDQFALTLC